jgi:hypothetical protein
VPAEIRENPANEPFQRSQPLYHAYNI